MSRLQSLLLGSLVLGTCTSGLAAQGTGTARDSTCARKLKPDTTILDTVGMSAPIQLNAPSPAYPSQLLDARYEGTVWLVIKLDTAGVPSNVEVIDSRAWPGRARYSNGTSPDFASVLFENAAVAWGRKLRFRPGMLRGRPISVLICKPVNFRIQ